MTQPLTFDAIVDDAAFFSWEHQLHLLDLGERLGEHRFQVDLDTRSLDLVGAFTLHTTANLLGSTAEHPGSWLWAWANPSGFAPEVTALAEAVADFGRRHGVQELVEAELPLTPEIGARLTEAAKVITGRWTAYSCAVGPGSRAYFLVEAPELLLPAPSTPRFTRVIGEALTNGLVRDHRRALLSYARLRQLPTTVDPAGTRVDLRLPDGQLTVTLDEAGRISNMSARTPGST